jgi:type I restriction enzyme, R subunit
MLAPATFLDLVRNFIVFERDDKSGRTVRKLCRYQQFAAVNKAITRARTAKKPTERGGVVWHTQGSGKSLTMLWLALKLRRDAVHENPTLVIVTDRKDFRLVRFSESRSGRECSPPARAALRATGKDHPHDSAEISGG